MARQVKVQVEIDATTGDVWKAISEAEELQKWFAPIAKVEPGKGGTMFVSWGPGAEGTASIEEWEPEQRLTISMPPSASTLRKLEAAGLAGTNLIVDYFIETRNGKTILTLVQSGFGDESAWDAELDGTGVGWVVFLHNLRHIVTHFQGKSVTGIMHWVRTNLSDRQAAWRQAAEALYGPEILKAKSGDSYQAAGVSGTVEYSEPGKCLFVTAREINQALLGFSVTDARGVAMVTWGALLADVTPEEAEQIKAGWAAALDKAFSSAATA